MVAHQRVKSGLDLRTKEDIALLFRFKSFSAVKGVAELAIDQRWNILEFFCESRSYALLFPWIRECDFYAENACCVRKCGGIGAADVVRLFFFGF